ncbi:MAG TPA: 23S rRNA (cytosine(1962)-C(5))-methyltransferase RlmI, partial [Burkholderiales bacterium]|nr:23S rRNA (cytosine(1962)-C(5))-methyltransferase RlmI [Burkholderiales bacterium]
MAKLILKAGREKSLLRRHPWIFSGAVERLDGSAESGATIAVHTSQGQFLAWAAYSPQSQIVARVWSFERSITIDQAFFHASLQRAIALRDQQLALGAGQGVRLVNGESDGLPGVVVDRYADVVVMQLTSAGGYRWRDTLVDALQSLTGARAIFERSDADVLTLEGLTPSVGVRSGELDKGPVRFEENGLAFEVDFQGGHKTGFYLDQRDNRAL